MKRILLALVGALAITPVAEGVLVFRAYNVVPTSAGNLDLRYLDGNDGTAAIPLTWAVIGPFTNVIEGTTPCYNLRTYLSEPGSPAATLSLVGSVTNWSLSTDNLCYDGSGVSSGTLIARATRNAVVSDSASFAVGSVASSGTDATPPTIITGLVCTEVEDPVCTFDASADVRVSGENVSGLDTFTVYRGATPLTPTVFTGTGLEGPAYVSADVGTLSPAGTSTQDDADWQQTAEGQMTSSADEFRFTSTAVTGDFTCSVKVVSITNGTNAGRFASLIMREQSGTLRRYFQVRLFPSLNIRSNYRQTAGGAITQAGLVTVSLLPAWIQINRSGSTLISRASQDGNDWGEVLSLSLGLNQSLDIGLATASNENGVATTVEYENLACTTRQRQTYTDTGAVADTTYSYTVINDDVANNVAAASAAVSVTTPPVSPPPGGGSDTPAYVDPMVGVTLLGQTTTNVANSSALTTELADQDCGETLSLANGTYTGNRTISRSCPANNPFIVKCANGLNNCVATGVWTITGSRAIVTGIDFNGASVRIDITGVNAKFIGNRIRNRTGTIAMNIGSNSQTGIDDVEVAYNTIGPFAGAATSTHYGIRSNNDFASAGTVPLDAWIHHNDFNGHKDGTGNDTDYMEPGNGSAPYEHTLLSGWYIEDNLFRTYADCNQNAVDMKYGGAFFLRNTIDNACSVKLSQRNGSFDIFESNYLDPGIILTHGRGSKVVCNRGSIRVNAGASAYNHTGQLNGLNPHDQSYQTLVESNNGALSIGHVDSGTDTLPALETTVRNHTGSVSCGLEEDTVGACGSSPIATPTYECEAAVKLTTGDVGPEALGSSSAAYRAARGL